MAVLGADWAAMCCCDRAAANELRHAPARQAVRIAGPAGWPGWRTAVVAGQLLAPGPFRRFGAAHPGRQRPGADGLCRWRACSGATRRGNLAALWPVRALGGARCWSGLAAPRTQNARAGHAGGRAGRCLVALDLYVGAWSLQPRRRHGALARCAPQGTPPVVTFLNARARPGNPRAPPGVLPPLTCPATKTFNANVGMYYGWHDLRGYDSIIPRQYVAVDGADCAAGRRTALQPHRAALCQPGGDVYAVLDNPLLDLLNVKYVLTEHDHPQPVLAGDLSRPSDWRLRKPRSAAARVDRARSAGGCPPPSSRCRRPTCATSLFIEETPADANALVACQPASGRGAASAATPPTMSLSTST